MALHQPAPEPELEAVDEKGVAHESDVSYGGSAVAAPEASRIQRGTPSSRATSSS